VSGQLDRRLTIKLSALYQQRKTAGSNMVDVTLADTPLYGPYQHQRLSGTDGLDTHLQLYSLSLTSDLGPVSLVSLTGYQRLFFSNPTDLTMAFGALLPSFYPDATNVGLGFQNVVHTDRWTQELRFSSSGPQHWQYVAGLFYSGESNQVNELLAPATYTTGEPLPALPTFYNAAIAQDYKQYAVFANITLQLTDQFAIAAGGRYSHTEQNVLQTRSGLIAGTPSESGFVTENPTTYSLTAQDRFSKDQMLYARIASGYGTGGPNFHYPPGHQSFEPDKTVNYEIGLKTEWLGDRLLFNPSVYYIDWRKIQVLQVAGGLAYFINGGKASSKGVEMAFTFLPLSQLAITADASYDDARLTEDAPPNTFFGHSGDQLPFTAKWTGHAAAEYRWPTNWGITMLAGAAAAYTGARRIDFSSVATVPRLRLPAFATLDLRLGASWDRLRAILFVRNVGGKRGYRGGSDFPTGTTDSPDGPWDVALIAPRTIGISFTAEF
jgi:hypothetical protein